MAGVKARDGVTSLSPQLLVPPIAPLPKVAPSGATAARFGEPLKFLPILYVLSIIAYLYAVYVFCHCLPRLQLGENDDLLDIAERRRAQTDLIVFHVLFALLLSCYAMSILVHPGSIPDDDPVWDYFMPENVQATVARNVNLQEAKKSGDRRHCKWCGKYKPDRCHHCRVCRVCVLKMDHHCPWIYNCVGFRNYKYFFLLLVYCALSCHWIVWTMCGTVGRELFAKNASMTYMFIVLFGETLAGFMALLTTVFLGFHIWLASRAMTTIEFCEKQLPKKGTELAAEVSRYDGGLWRNLCNTLGDNPFLWFLPMSPPPGDGLSYATSSERTDLLAVDGEGDGKLQP